MIKPYHFFIHKTIKFICFGDKRLQNETIGRLESECERP